MWLQLLCLVFSSLHCEIFWHQKKWKDCRSLHSPRCQGRGDPW